MTRPEHPRMTLSEFLVWEDGTDTRYHLIEGQPVPIPIEYVLHGEIMANLCLATQPFATPWKPLPSFGVVPPHRPETIYIADFLVTAARLDGRAQFRHEPRIIFEILSPGTAVIDHCLKIPDLREIPSVTDIVLISMHAYRAEHWRREGGSWRVACKSRDDAIEFADPGVSIAVDSIYGYGGLLPSNVAYMPPEPIFAS